MRKKQLQKRIDKQHGIIEMYLLIRHQKGDTLERIKIRNVQTAIKNLIDLVSHDDYEMICDENKNMAKALNKLGYTNDQVSDVCNGAI